MKIRFKQVDKAEYQNFVRSYPNPYRVEREENRTCHYDKRLDDETNGLIAYIDGVKFYVRDYAGN